MKNRKLKSSLRPAKDKRRGNLNVIDTVVKEGDLISFDPTGEKLRVAKIEGGQITFEKTP